MNSYSKYTNEGKIEIIITKKVQKKGMNNK